MAEPVFLVAWWRPFTASDIQALSWILSCRLATCCWHTEVFCRGVGDALPRQLPLNIADYLRIKIKEAASGSSSSHEQDDLNMKQSSISQVPGACPQSF